MPATIDGWFQALLQVVFLVYVVRCWIRAFRHRPKLRKEEIRYEERWASGYSLANPLTMLGGGRNCVRLVVTNEFVWVTTWLPFVLISSIYDMEHVIPLEKLEYLRAEQTWLAEGLELAYRDERDRQHRLALQPRNTSGFVHAVRTAAARLSADSVHSSPYGR